jgi:hypothetical protein
MVSLSALLWLTLSAGTASAIPPEGSCTGDYNDDGMCSAADYTVWRNNLGGMGEILQNRDLANIGNVSISDYNSWKAHFGEAAGSGSSGGTGGAVPEPSGLMLVAIGGFVACGCMARRRAATLATALVLTMNLATGIAVAAPSLACDYNNNGVCDAADYTVWRNMLGSNGSLPNEGASFGTVDQADYDLWKANFGQSIGSGSGSGAGILATSTPEPASWLLATAAMMFFGLRRPRRYAYTARTNTRLPRALVTTTAWPRSIGMPSAITSTSWPSNSALPAGMRLVAAVPCWPTRCEKSATASR